MKLDVKVNNLLKFVRRCASDTGVSQSNPSSAEG